MRLRCLDAGLAPTLHVVGELRVIGLRAVVQGRLDSIGHLRLCGKRHCGPRLELVPSHSVVGVQQALLSQHAPRVVLQGIGVGFFNAGYESTDTARGLTVIEAVLASIPPASSPPRGATEDP